MLRKFACSFYVSVKAERSYHPCQIYFSPKIEVLNCTVSISGFISGSDEKHINEYVYHPTYITLQGDSRLLFVPHQIGMVLLNE